MDAYSTIVIGASALPRTRSSLVICSAVCASAISGCGHGVVADPAGAINRLENPRRITQISRISGPSLQYVDSSRFAIHAQRALGSDACYSAAKPGEGFAELRMRDPRELAP